MQNFKLINEGISISLIPLVKASGVAIGEGKMVTLDAGALAVEAGATSAKLAYAPFGAQIGETTVLVVAERNAIFEGTAAQAFALTDKSKKVDLSISGANQLIDNAHTAVSCLQIIATDKAGTVGSTAKVRFTIALPLVDSL